MEAKLEEEKNHKQDNQENGMTHKWKASSMGLQVLSQPQSLSAGLSTPLYEWKKKKLGRQQPVIINTSTSLQYCTL